MSHQLSRREVIISGAVLAASAVVAGAAQPEAAKAATQEAPKKPARTLRKAVMIGMVNEGATLVEKFRILKDCGFDGAEMDSPSNIKIEEILEAQAKTGIKAHGVVDSMHWHYHLNSPEAKIRELGVDALKQALRDAKAMGAGSVLLVPGVVNAKQSYDDAWKLSMEGIRAALPVAAECGVRISVENVWNNFLLSPLEAARYIDELNHPMAAWHFDIGNVINTGFPDQWIRVLGKRISRLHIKDFSRKKRDDQGLWKGFDVELGDGDAGWASVMKALDEVGYSTHPEGNWATAEVRGGDHVRLMQVGAQMDKLFAM